MNRQSRSPSVNHLALTNLTRMELCNKFWSQIPTERISRIRTRNHPILIVTRYPTALIYLRQLAIVPDSNKFTGELLTISEIKTTKISHETYIYFLTISSEVLAVFLDSHDVRFSCKSKNKT